MKKFLLLLLLLGSFVNVQASPYNRVIFFGDSLTDNGNLYHLILKIIPKSPPYYEGRFSNGPIWSEHIGEYYHEKYNASYKIYAVGGATAFFHPPSTKFIAPSTLQIQIDLYLANAIFQNKSNTLYVMWIGSNDYIFGNEENNDATAQKVIDNIVWAINNIRYAGGKHFLIMNVPDLSKTPFVKDYPTATRLHELSVLHNQKLADAMNAIKNADPDTTVTVMDVFSLFNDMMTDPAKYNDKYNMHISNVTGACWHGDFLQRRKLPITISNTELQQAIIQQNGTMPKGIDVDGMGRFIANSPSLSYVYALGQLNDQLPCLDPDDYLFWDALHPSAVAHRVLAEIVEETLEKIPV